MGLVEVVGLVLGAITITSVIAGAIFRSHNVGEIKKVVKELRDKVVELTGIRTEINYIKEIMNDLRNEIKALRKERGAE